MSKKRPVSNDTLIRLSAIEAIKEDDSIDYLSMFRFTYDSFYFRGFINQLEKIPIKLTSLLAGKSLRKLEELDSSHLLGIGNYKELAWAKVIISKNIDPINRFISVSEKFQNNLLLGKFEKARENLELIENEFGQSLWLIKNRIALLQYTEGLEIQKSYVNELKSRLKDRNMVKFIVHMISIRNEDNTSMNRFSKRVHKAVAKFSEVNQPGYKEYCLFHLLGEEFLDKDKMCNVLRMEYSRSLIDYYEAYVSVIRSFCLNKDDWAQKKASEILKLVCNIINDKRLHITHTMVSDEYYSGLSDISSINIYNSYLSGNYKKVSKDSTKELLKNPNNPINLILFSYSKGMKKGLENTALNKYCDLPKKTALNQFFLDHLSTIVKNGVSSAVQETSDLKKAVLNFACLPSSAIISVFIKRESELFYKFKDEDALLVLKVPLLHTLLSKNLVGTLIEKPYSIVCSNLYQDTPLYDFDNEKSHSVESEHLEKSFKAYNQSDFENAINHARNLVTSRLDFFRRKALGIISYSEFNLNHLLNSCKLSVDFYLGDRNIYNFLPITQLFKSIQPGTDEWDHLSSHVEFPILLHAYVKNTSHKGLTNLRFAYEDFLLKNDMKRPSQIESVIHEFQEEKIIYYLSKICVESNMDTSGEFEEGGSSEVLSERLAVCRLLVRITNSLELKKEIEGLIRKQVIKSKRLEVDKSRIYTDIPKIKEWVKDEFSESFNRYKDYLISGLVDIKSLQNDSTKKNVSDNFSDGLLIPKNEARALIKSIIQEVISAYLSPEFGLDRFISTRIRHGILENQLRPSLERPKLITKKKSKNGPYLDNDYWTSKLSQSGTVDQINSLNQIFKEFSESYDALISEINLEWLQIKSSSKPRGLFDFVIGEDSITNLSEKVDSETLFEGFIDIIITSLDNLLIRQLTTIRELIINAAKPRAKNLLINFQEKISQEPDLTSLGEFQDTVGKAKIEMQNQFDLMVEWFVPSNEGESAPFLIEDAASVAEAIIKEGADLFKVVVESEEEEEVSIHGSLPIFVDIFLNLFDNVVKRSGLEYPQAIVNIKVEDFEGKMRIYHIEVVNEISDSHNLDEIEEILKEKRKLIETGDYLKMIANEGNSGLFKVYKSSSDLRNSFGVDTTSHMRFDINENVFSVNISLPFELISLEDNEK